MQCRENDRTVHAWSGDEPRGELVRYDRAGKWYIEWPGRGLPRQLVTIAEAVDLAMYWWGKGGTPCLGKPGGARFDALLRRRCER